MATNLRAYRDGNRLVLVIENPTKDLESIVGSLISGEVNPVKDLTEPKPMAKPKVDISKMQEIPSKPETHSPVSNQEPKKAPFVRKLEEQQAAAKTDAGKPVTTQVKPQAQETAIHAHKVEMVEEEMQTTAVGPKATDTAKASAVSNAKPQTATKQQMPTARPVNAQAKQQTQAPAAKPQPIAKPSGTQATTNASSERTALIKKVWSMRGNAKVKALLKAKYQDENYDIRRLSTAQLEYLSKL